MSTVSTVAPKTSPVAAVAAAAAGAAALVYTTTAKAEMSWNPLTWFSSAPAGAGPEWDAVKSEVEEILEDDANHGPFFVRLAWHCAGSYDAASGTGGSDGATMRFAPEADHGGNAGLGLARDLLEPIKAKHPELSYADIYTYAGKAAIELMGGPSIPWSPGRSDAVESEHVPTPDGRLPDAGQGATHLRDVFNRMGFDDREIVALSGAHSMGFCHDDRSGFVGPWTAAPTTFSNMYYDDLLNKKWVLKVWDGPAQFIDSETQTFMMLPTDMALLCDPGFRSHVDRYAADTNNFSVEFAAAFGKLLALGTKA